MISEAFQQIVIHLLAEIGVAGDIQCFPLKGGANNKVFRVDANGSDFLLKTYFQHADDPRDRLGAEFSFSSFAWQHGIRCLPQPLCCSTQHQIGLYEFVQGRQLLPHEVNENTVQQALQFYNELNHHKQRQEAQALKVASEACFTIANHLRCVERRLQRLRQIDESSAAHCEAKDFIHNELFEIWHAVKSSVCEQAVKLNISLSHEIDNQDKCLSPSDFGFHNAILGHDGYLRFIDFEYAGWDDPAKMVCDFFCQPALPVPLDYYDLFVEHVTLGLSEPGVHRKRIVLLLPVYQLKWICILLNDFLPVGNQRRQFADTAIDQEERKKRQLQKARQALQQITR